MSSEDVHKIAMGRVWTGSQALDRGLVDKLGGMDTAIAEIKNLANISAEVELLDYSGYENQMNFSVDFQTGILAKSQPDLPADMQILLDWWQTFSRYENEKALMLSPVQVTE